MFAFLGLFWDDLCALIAVPEGAMTCRERTPAPPRIRRGDLWSCAVHIAQWSYLIDLSAVAFASFSTCRDEYDDLVNTIMMKDYRQHQMAGSNFIELAASSSDAICSFVKEKFVSIALTRRNVALDEYIRIRLSKLPSRLGASGLRDVDVIRPLMAQFGSSLCSGSVAHNNLKLAAKIIAGTSNHNGGGILCTRALAPSRGAPPLPDTCTK